MLPINNSDTAWLIVADYNQDNDYYHEELREDVLNPVIDEWNCEFYCEDIKDFGTNSQMVGGDTMGDLVGNGEYDITDMVNDHNGAAVNRGVIGELVGGNPYDPNK